MSKHAGPSDGNLNWSEKTLKLIPSPLISTTKTYNRTGDGEIIGFTYQITLTGTIVAHRGSPDQDGTFHGEDSWAAKHGGADKDSNETIPIEGVKNRLLAIEKKQTAIRNLFSHRNEGFVLEVFNDSDGGWTTHGARVTSIEFPEGTYTDVSPYTIQMEADYLQIKTMMDHGDGDDGSTGLNRINEWLIQSAEESWNLDVNPDNTITYHKPVSGSHHYSIDDVSVQKTYRLSQTLSCQGKRKYSDADHDPDYPSEQRGIGNLIVGGEAWQQASGYVISSLALDHNADNLAVGTDNDHEKTKSSHRSDLYRPLYSMPGFRQSGGVTLPEYMRAFNHSRSQTIDKRNGSFQITQEWIVASGGGEYPEKYPVTETVEARINENDNGDTTVSINGTLTGLTGGVTPGVSSHPSGIYAPNNRIKNAAKRFKNIEAELYIRARMLTDGEKIKRSPTNKSISYNPGAGTVTYSYDFEGGAADTCDILTIPGAKSEDINITDTYPGQVFSSTPVLGRKLGPVFQDVGTQTEWRRSLSIECVVSGVDHRMCDADNSSLSSESSKYGRDYAGRIGLMNDRKPSNITDARASYKSITANPEDDDDVEMTRDKAVAKEPDIGAYNQQKAIREIIKAASPRGKPGIAKYFVVPAPQESWNPKTGRWSYQIEWVYETVNSSVFGSELDLLDEGSDDYGVFFNFQSPATPQMDYRTIDYSSDPTKPADPPDLVSEDPAKAEGDYKDTNPVEKPDYPSEWDTTHN